MLLGVGVTLLLFPLGWVCLDLFLLSVLTVPVFLTGVLSFFLENTVSGERTPPTHCQVPSFKSLSAAGAASLAPSELLRLVSGTSY